MWWCVHCFGPPPSTARLPLQGQDPSMPWIIHDHLSVTGARQAACPCPAGGTPHRFAVVPRRRVADGGGLAGGVAFPCRRVDAGGGLVGGKAPSCSRACSARTPTL